jgi:hypothetical protein
LRNGDQRNGDARDKIGARTVCGRESRPIEWKQADAGGQFAKGRMQAWGARLRRRGQPEARAAAQPTTATLLFRTQSM